MGCCAQRHQIITPLTLDQLSKISSVRESILYYSDVFISDFEKLLFDKIIPTKPRSMHEFDNIFNYCIKTIAKNYNDYTSTSYSNDPFIVTEVRKCKSFLISKCKSKEGYFRLLNNIYSFEFIFQLEKFLIEKLNKQLITEEICIGEYNKFARGSYTLQGLEDIYEAFLIDGHKRIKFLEEKALIIRKELKEFREQLISAENYKEIPGIKEEIPSTTISFNNAPEASFSEYADSQYNDLDFDPLELDPPFLLPVRQDRKPMKNNFFN